MTDIRSTTTNYRHPTDPNLLNIHKAMKFNSDGEPVVRTHVDGISLQGDVIVNTVSLSSSTLAALESVNVQNNVTATITGTVAVSNFPTTSTVYQGTNPWVVSGNVNVTTTQTDVVLADSNYEMNVARGLVTGQYLEFKNGYSPDMAATGGAKTVWSQDAVYPWSSWTTAQHLHIISTSAADTGQTLYIDGLDGSYNRISETVTTNGTTVVQTANNYLRINHVYLTAGSTNVGTITQRLTSGTGTVIGGMLPGLARNKQGVFTVPAGYTAYIMYGDITSYKNGQGQIDGQVDMMVRTSQTTPFMNVFTGIAANGQFRNDFRVPLATPERADIDVRFDPSGACTVSCNWQMILIAN